MGDELWQRFQRAEKEMEEEVKDVVNEVGGAGKCRFRVAELTLRVGECFCA